MQPIEPTGLFNSTFAGNIKDVALPLAELQLKWRNKSLMLSNWHSGEDLVAILVNSCSLDECRAVQPLK